MRAGLRMDKKEQALILCLLLVGITSVFAAMTQSNFGSIEIKNIRIVEENGLTVSGKLYRPVSATSENPAPAVLLLHGMNNDKDTEGPAALELAKHGIVALALDELSHGDSDRVVDLLGYLTGTSAQTLGGNVSYHWLQSLPFVDGARIGLIGHSMGAATATAIARTNPDHKAIAIQADGPYNLTENYFMNNYLAVWSFYEELFTTQPRDEFLAESLEIIAQNEGLSSPDEAQVDFTYGSFSDGSAHRYAKCPCTHPGATWNPKGVAEITTWMLQALLDFSESEAWARAGIETQTFMYKEIATLIGLISAFLSIIPLSGILLETSYFSKVKGPMPTRIPTEGKRWWLFASLNAVIGGITFLFLPGLGLTLGVVLAQVAQIFLLVTGNGLILWFLVNALIAWILFKLWFRKEQRSQNPISYDDLGRFATIREQEAKDVIFRTIQLSIVLFTYLYIVAGMPQFFLGIELRYMWPVFKLFTPERFIQFLINILPIFPFFLVNGGLFAFGMIRQPPSSDPIRTQFIWWLKIVFAMESVLLVMILVNYLPMFLLGTGPILLMGLYGIFLMAYLPIFGGLFFLMTAFYQQTGRIYLGSIMATLLTVWILTAGMLI